MITKPNSGAMDPSAAAGSPAGAARAPFYYQHSAAEAQPSAAAAALTYPFAYPNSDGSTSSSSYYYYQSPVNVLDPSPSSSAMAAAGSPYVGYGAGYSYTTAAELAGSGGAGLVSGGGTGMAGRQYGFDPKLYVQAVAARSSDGIALFAAQPNWNQHHAQFKHGLGKQIKKKALVQPAFCEVCKIACSSMEILQSHKNGKKHKSNLAKLQDAITPKPEKTSELVKNVAAGVKDLASASQMNVREQFNSVDVATQKDLELKKLRVLEAGAAIGEVRICSICNVVVNNQLVYQSHIAGSKHAAMVKKFQDLDSAKPSDVPTDVTQLTEGKGASDASEEKVEFTGETPKLSTAQDLEFKKRKVLEAGAAIDGMRICTVCNVVVNNEKVYAFHITGSKHASMVKKLQDSNIIASSDQPTTVTNPAHSGAKPEQEKLKPKSLIASPEDVELKKRKLLEAGAPSQEVRVCYICNVVVNNQKVFEFHLAGSKHAAKIKMLQQKQASVC